MSAPAAGPEPSRAPLDAIDLVVVGGGIVGLASARAAQLDGRRVVVLEAERDVATHQTGHNSGVIHSGLYYKPGSEKARTCTRGRELLYELCEREGIPHRRCGKLVVATDPSELPRLEMLRERGSANGLADLHLLGPAEIRAHEPEAAGIAGIFVRETGTVDFKAVSAALRREIERRGGEVRTGARLRRVRREAGGLRLETGAGTVRCRQLVNCAGLESDRVARLCGVRPDVRIVPFRGDYYELVPQRADLVRGLIYPVPDPAFPFLGVHFTRGVDDKVEAGPNAVPSLSRRGYGRFALAPRDVLSMVGFVGTWRLGAKLWRTGLDEALRSLSRRRFAKALRRLVPAVRDADLHWAGCGIRAQAVDRRGGLLDDFHVIAADGAVHVLNAPSPAATASLAIGETVARLARTNLA